MLELPFDEVSDVDLDREIVRRGGFAEFAKLAWDVIPGPQPLIWTWHLSVIAKHLQAMSQGELRRLMICIPPGTGKTKLTSVLWPAWDWTIKPRRRFMSATYSHELTKESATLCRSLVRSKWYSDRWPNSRLDTSLDASETVANFGTIAGGKRFSSTVDGQLTGFHGNIQIIDDPTKPRDVDQGGDVAKNALERTWAWWTGTMSSRTIGSDFMCTLIMQRLCEGDLVDRILNSKGASEWTLLSLPMFFEEQRACSTPWGKDERTHEGELLCPEYKSAEAVRVMRDTMGERVAAAQLQQRPTPGEGTILKREWFKERWTELPPDLTMVQSWDTTVKGGVGADYTAGHIWGYANGKYYLVDRLHDRMGFPEVCKLIKAWTIKWPHAYGKLIENAATGPAIEQTLRDVVSGIILVKPQDIGGSKEARVNAIAPFVEAGNVVLPAASWGDAVLEEMVAFPLGRHDDDVDAATQAIQHLHTRSHARYLGAMKAVREGKLDSFFKKSA